MLKVTYSQTAMFTDSDSEEEGEEVQSRPRDPSQAVKVSVPCPAQRAANARKAMARQLLLVSISFLSKNSCRAFHVVMNLDVINAV